MGSRIKGGYYIKARKIQESEIAHASPCIRELWDYLIMICNHKQQRSSGRTIKRGQTVKTYQEIQDGLSWFIGYRKESYTKDAIENAMKWLTKRGMITKAKTTRGISINICNYEFYQNPENYEHHSEDHNNTTITPQPTATINKNDKNVINNIYTEEETLPNPKLEEVIEFFTLSGHPEKWAKKFFFYYEAQDWMTSGQNSQPVRNWKAKANEWLLTPSRFENLNEVTNVPTNTNKQFNQSRGKGAINPDVFLQELRTVQKAN